MVTRGLAGAVKRSRSNVLLYFALTTLWLGGATSQAAEREFATLEGHAGGVLSLAYSPDGKTLASASADKTVILWDVATRSPRATLEGHTDSISAVAFSPDGTTVASAGADKSIKLWDSATGKERTTLRGHTHAVTSLTFCPDGKTLASGAGTYGQPGEVKLWDVVANNERASFEATLSVTCLAISPNDETVAAGCSSGVQLWDVATGKERRSAWTHFFGELHSIAFSPDGKTLATGGGYKNRPSQTVLWDVETGKQRAAIGQLSGISAVAFSPDGKTLAAWTSSLSGPAELKLFDPATAQERASLHPDDVTALAFHPDNKTLAIASGKNTIVLWDLGANK